MGAEEPAVICPYVPLAGEPCRNPLSIDDTRKFLVKSNEMAVAPLCFAAMKHACEGVTHSDAKLRDAYILVSSMCSNGNQDEMSEKGENSKGIDADTRRTSKGPLYKAMKDVGHWFQENRLKAFFMVVGLGGTAFKAHSIALFMQTQAQDFIDWGITTTPFRRFGGFVALMMVRLVVSTLIPPTSPGFGIIIQAATPEDEKWTAMPLFLLSSAVAGAMPYVLDKFLQCCTGEDFLFTMAAKRFAQLWPLTCWTDPVMEKVFLGAGGGTTGATLAIIFAHAAPFMGAQTTILQRYFLPHPLDSIISQPFGMSEDLFSMGLAEARTNPILASISITVLTAGFNITQFQVFSQRTDIPACVIAALNIAVGLLIVSEAVMIVSLAVVGLQFAIQMFVMPFLINAFLGRSKDVLPHTGVGISSSPGYVTQSKVNKVDEDTKDPEKGTAQRADIARGDLK